MQHFYSGTQLGCRFITLPARVYNDKALPEPMNKLK